jgi:hypothetical protein
MGGARTYGFGRVSPAVKPSPYSPLHRPSEIPGSPAALPDAARRSRRPGPRRRVVAVLLALAVVVALTGIVTLFGRTASPTSTMRSPTEAMPTLASDEASRLSRSAIAVHRYAPRPRS